MTEDQCIDFFKEWVELNKKYQQFFKKNSLYFPEPILIEFLTIKLPNLSKNPSVNRKRATYDMKDENNLNVEVKSSFNFGPCWFSDKQSNCDRIIYVNLNNDQFDIYEIDNTEVVTINNKVLSNGRCQCFFKNHMNNGILLHSISLK